MNHYEYSQQKALFQWAAIHEKIYPQLKWMYHIPNGYVGDQSKIVIRGKLVSKAAIQMNRMKAAGLKSGVWDIFLPVPVQKNCGMYIEMKSPREGLSENQEMFMNDNLKYYSFFIAYDWIVARDAIVLYLAGEQF